MYKFQINLMRGKHMSHSIRNLLTLFLLITLFVCGGCSGAADNGAGGFTGVGTDNVPDESGDTGFSHDNIVKITTIPVDNSMAFTATEHNITPGQPWEGVSANLENGIFTIDVKCGRKGSLYPLAWFQNSIQNSPIASTRYPYVEPHSMNFAVNGTMRINGTDYAITIGQVGIGLRNVWYMSGVGFTGQNGSIVTPDGRYSFFSGGADDTFGFGTIGN